MQNIRRHAKYRQFKGLDPIMGTPIHETVILDPRDNVMRPVGWHQDQGLPAIGHAQQAESLPAAEALALRLGEIGPIEPTLLTLEWIQRPCERLQMPGAPQGNDAIQRLPVCRPSRSIG